MQKFNVEIVYTNEFNPRSEMSIVETTSFFTLSEAVQFYSSQSVRIRTEGRRARLAIWRFQFNEKLNVWFAPSNEAPILNCEVAS
jgi:hypothetical protein